VEAGAAAGGSNKGTSSPQKEVQARVGAQRSRVYPRAEAGGSMVEARAETGGTRVGGRTAGEKIKMDTEAGREKKVEDIDSRPRL